VANSKYKISKITQSAEGEECQVRYPGSCNFNNETTIFAHLGGAGMGRKHADIFGAYCCSSCHDIADSRSENGDFSEDLIALYFHEGIFRTQQILFDKGLIKI
jgi:hypothetical protein